MFINVGLCRGRHEIPAVEDYIFQQELNPLDIKGMFATVAEVIRYCYSNGISLTLYYYNRESGEYYPQTM